MKCNVSIEGEGEDLALALPPPLPERPCVGLHCYLGHDTLSAVGEMARDDSSRGTEE